MHCVIENEYLTASFCDLGAELVSLVSKDGTEYIWQGNAPYWSSHASVLFPVCGRLTNGEYQIDEQLFKMDRHGFARKKVFQTADCKKDEITFELCADDATKSIYPFDFALKIRYFLSSDSLCAEFTVTNPMQDTILPFSLGWHPGFLVPPGAAQNGASAFSDWRVSFADPNNISKVDQTEEGFFSGTFSRFEPIHNGILPLSHSLFDHDAVFLQHTGGRVRLFSDKSSRSICVDYPDMPYLGLWHTPHTEAPFLCIEPWNGLPSRDGVRDDLFHKYNVTLLNPLQNYSNTIRVSVR